MTADLFPKRQFPDGILKSPDFKHPFIITKILFSLSNSGMKSKPFVQKRKKKCVTEWETVKMHKKGGGISGGALKGVPLRNFEKPLIIKG